MTQVNNPLFARVLVLIHRYGSPEEVEHRPGTRSAVRAMRPCPCGSSIEAAGFGIERGRRVTVRPNVLAAPVAPRILGVARR